MKTTQLKYLLWKAVIYLIIAAAIFLIKDDIVRYITAALYFVSAYFSFLYGKANKDLELIYKKDFAIGYMEIFFGIAILISPLLGFPFTSVIAVSLIFLALFQMNVAILSGTSKVATSTVMNIVSIIMPILTIIPAGFIMTGYPDQKMGDHSNELILAIMFLVAAALNYLYVNNARNLSYTSEKENDGTSPQPRETLGDGTTSEESQH